MGNSNSSLSKPFSGKIKYDRNDVLGVANAIVYRGTYKSKKIAVKRIQLPPSSIADPTEDREIAIQIKLDHRNVLKILRVEHDEDFRYKQYMFQHSNKNITLRYLCRYIVLDLCGGTLKSFCTGEYNGPDLPPDQTVLKEIASGLNYIHSNQLFHRDIKPENILISSTTPIHVKISDFGLSKETSENQTFSVSGPYKGTWKWMAPEQFDIMGNNIYGATNGVKKRGSCKSDIFSAGLVFFYFVTRGVHPHGETTNSSDEIVLRNIKNNNQVNFYSKFLNLPEIVENYSHIHFSPSLLCTELRTNHFATAAIRGMTQSQPKNRASLIEVLALLGKIQF